MRRINFSLILIFLLFSACSTRKSPTTVPQTPTAPITPTPLPSVRERIRSITDYITGLPTVNNLPAVTPTPLPVTGRRLVALNQLPTSNEPSDVTAIIGYAFDPGDVSQPITDEALENARAIVRKAAAEGALWLDADTGITNFAESFLNDPALSYYPLAQTIIEEAHQAGIRVFFYFSGTEVETVDYANKPKPTFEEQFSDWLQIDQFGKPMFFAPGEFQAFWVDETTADSRLTPLAPGYREALYSRAEKLAALGADGIFVDVPYFFTVEERWGDFSSWSRQAFKQATGLDLPVNLDADGRAFWIWVEWRHQVWADFFAGMRARIQQANPHTLMIVEEYPGADPYGAIETGLDTALLGASVDVATHEYSHLQDEGGAVAFGPDDWQHTRDVYKWYQGFNQVNWSLCYATNSPDSKALAAITYAHQQSFWETKAPTMLDESTGEEWRKQLLAWMRENAGLYDAAQPAAEVAVLYSSRIRDLTFASSLDDLILVQHALDRQGIPYVILTEPEIQRIHDFPYVIFPNVKSTTDAVWEEVSRYTGKLLLVGDSFTRDGWDEMDRQPPAALLTLEQAIAAIETIPVQLEGANRLMVELYRQGEDVQIRIFNPNLDGDFNPQPQTVTLKFKWDGGTPKVSAFEFLADAPQELTPIQVNGVWQVTVSVDWMITITVKSEH